MEISVKGFIYHKDAESFEDCFDRYAVNNTNHKFSVSDGVSKSFFPGIWAELLVTNFVDTPGRVNLIETGLLRNIQQSWSKKVSEIVQRPNQKYFVKNFFAQGRSAAATFVGLNFFWEYGRQRWEAVALGDSFLFFVPHQVKDLDNQFDNIIFLSSKKNFEFDNFPDFFDSIHPINKGKIKQIKHDLTPGTFYLMTDALSEWFINEKSNAVSEIETWDSQARFEERVSVLRKHHLQNDDTALLIIEVYDSSLPDIHYRDINITNLRHLITPNSEQKEFGGLFDNKIDEIGQKFMQAPPEPKVSFESKQIIPSDFKNPTEGLTPKQAAKTVPDYLITRHRPKKKKRNFWEKNVELITSMFSGKTKPADDDDDKKEDPFKDLDSITDKF